LISSCVSVDNRGENRMTQHDWAGIYTGIIPGADSAGINIQVTLNNDETYKVNYQYIDKSDDVFTYTGTFKWDNKGGTITLDSKDIPPHYKVGENMLIQLDMKGKVIGGALADNYVLRKKQ